MSILRKAVTRDSESIFKLINPYAEENIILKRTVEDIEESIEKFIVAVDREKIIGAVSYYDYGAGLKEIRSLAVRDDYKKTGVGSKLTSAVVGELLQTGSVKIFALTYSPGFFVKNRFHIVDKGTLPDKIWKDCRYCKNRDNCTETAVVFNG